MAITLSDNARNAACNAVVNLVNGGTLRLRDGSTILCDIPLDSTNAFEDAGTSAAGVARAIGQDGENPIDTDNPLEGVGEAAGEADGYQVLNSSDAVVWSGTVSGPGGGGDLVLDNPNIAVDQNVRITSFSHTAPA